MAYLLHYICIMLWTAVLFACLFLKVSAMKFALLHRNWCQNLTFVFPWMYGHISLYLEWDFLCQHKGMCNSFINTPK